MGQNFIEDQSKAEDIGAAVNPVTESLSNVFLFLLIFGMSATVDVDSLVRQLKNKYASPTPLGYRDINLCLRVALPDGGGHHLCEIQLNLQVSLQLLLQSLSCV